MLDDLSSNALLASILRWRSSVGQHDCRSNLLVANAIDTDVLDSRQKSTASARCQSLVTLTILCGMMVLCREYSQGSVRNGSSSDDECLLAVVSWQQHRKATGASVPTRVANLHQSNDTAATDREWKQFPAVEIYLRGRFIGHCSIGLLTFNYREITLPQLLGIASIIKSTTFAEPGQACLMRWSIFE